MESIETYDFDVLEIVPTAARTRRADAMSNRIDRVVITGASSGIGFDMARRFLAEGTRVLLNARHPDKLEAARRRLEGGGRVAAVPGDVGDPATARAARAAAPEPPGGADSPVHHPRTSAQTP